MLIAQMMNLQNIDLYNIIFTQILKLQPCGGPGGWGCITGDFTHDFIYGLFLPHIILIIFLVLATSKTGHKGLGALLGTGMYVFIIHIGWYPIFATLSMYWIILSLIIAGFYFFGGRIIHPSRSEQVFDLAYKMTKRHMDKGKLLRKIDEDLRYAEQRQAEAKRNGETKKAGEWSKKIVELETYRREVERG